MIFKIAESVRQRRTATWNQKVRATSKISERSPENWIQKRKIIRNFSSSGVASLGVFCEKI
jgi:hypothetical protein